MHQTLNLFYQSVNLFYQSVNLLYSQTSLVFYPIYQNGDQSYYSYHFSNLWYLF